MAKIYCKYGGSTVSGAKNFSLTDVMDGTGQFSFQLPQQSHSQLSTWTARKNGEVTFYNSADDSILFIGVITYVVSRKNWITISGMGWLEALKWYPISEDQTNFEIWNGKVYDAPTTENVTTTQAFTGVDGTTPTGWTAHDVVGAFSTAGISTNQYYLHAVHGAGSGSAAVYTLVTDTDKLDGTYIQFKLKLTGFNTGPDTEYAEVHFYQDTTKKLWLRYEWVDPNVKLQYSTNGTDYTNLCNVAGDYITIKVVCNPVSDNFDIWIDGVETASDVSASFTSITKVDFFTQNNTDGPADTSYYIDDYTAVVSRYVHSINLVNSSGSLASELNPGFSNDGFNQPDVDRYLIISDSTKEEENITYYPSAISVNAGYTSPPTGAVGNLTDVDTNYCECIRGVLLTGTVPALIYLPLNIDAANTIADTSMITKIGINIIGKFAVGPNAEFDVYWSKDGTSLTRKIGTFQEGIWSFSSYQFAFNTTINIDIGDSASWFATSGGEYIDGGLIISLNYGVAADILLNQVEVTVYYATSTFDPVNQLISDTIHNVPADPSTNKYDTIKCYDDTPTADNFAFGGIGIAASDTAQICIGVVEAVNRCRAAKDCPAFWVQLNKGTDPKKGIGKKWVGATVFSGLSDIADQLGYVKFPRYNATTSMKELHMLPEASIDAATVTYSSASDPPNEINQIESQNNNYGWVVVCYKNGSTAPVQADTPSSDVKTKVIIDRNIVSETEAYEKAKAWANYYAIDHPSVELTWGTLPTNLFEIGTKYNFELDTYNGTIYTTTDFSDAICRRRTITQDGTPNGAWLIHGWFGGGSTPPNEKTGKNIADLANRLYKRDITDLTSDFTPVTVHSRLSGILGTGSQHISAAEAARLTAMYTGYTYVPLDSNDEAGFDYVAVTSTNADSVILDLVNGDSESKSAGIAETNNITTIPSTATAVQVRIAFKTSSANAANNVRVCRNGNSNTRNAIVVYDGGVATYLMTTTAIIQLASGKIKMIFARTAGELTCYLHILGYFI